MPYLDFIVLGLAWILIVWGALELLKWKDRR